MAINFNLVWLSIYKSFTVVYVCDEVQLLCFFFEYYIDTFSTEAIEEGPADTLKKKIN